MMLRRRVALGAVAVGLLVTAVVLVPRQSPGRAATSAAAEPDIFRAERVYGQNPVAFASCEGDNCALAVPGDFTVVFPAGMGRVDVAAWLMVEYQTTQGDGGEILMSVKHPNTAKKRMKPGSLALRSGPRSTTTLGWVEKGVDADGKHRFSWSVIGGPSADNPFRVRVTEAVLIIEATPSGG